MNFKALKNLRDTRGLSANEKAFLFVVISRGDETFGTWETNAADMGMSKGTYYRTRDALLEKGLIEVARKYNATSVYRPNLDVLATWDSHIGNDEATDSHIGNERSHIGNDDSQICETKKNTKKNIKENIKTEEEPMAVADAPASGNPSLPKENLESFSCIIEGDQIVPLKGLTYFLFDEGVTGPVALTETGDAAKGLSKATVSDIEEQVAGLAPQEGWTDAFAAQVLELALSPDFLEGKGTAGIRISKALTHIKTTETVEVW